MINPNSLVILGPTASGKTHLACHLADLLNGEIISMDSRQVYKGLDIGTGKDLSEYVVNNRPIPYHLIDLNEVHEKFYLHDLIQATRRSFEQILNRNRLPIFCGGTGLYLDSLRKDFSYTQAPEDPAFRSTAEKQSNNELKLLLEQLPAKYTRHIDKNSKKRLIRGIEVARFLSQNSLTVQDPTTIYKPFYIGLRPTMEELHERIRIRLKQRLEGGLIEETEMLLKRGIPFVRLIELGLEYKFVCQYLSGDLTKEELFEKLFTAIRQFSKRQMTWFRKMEKEGVKIHWITPELELTQILDRYPELIGFKKDGTLH